MRQHTKEARDANKKAGVCADCKGELDPRFGYTHCEDCRKKRAAQSQKNRSNRKKNGLCYYCGRPLTANDVGYRSHSRGECIPSRRLA